MNHLKASSAHLPKTSLILFILLLSPLFSSACLNTEQYKIFPVGIHKGNIVSVDFQIRRTSIGEGSRMLDLEIPDSIPSEPSAEMFILISRIRIYNPQQSLLESDTISSLSYSFGKDYSDTLIKSYYASYKRAQKLYPEMELFETEYLSFCDFYKSCEMVSLGFNAQSGQDQLLIGKSQYPLYIFSDSTYAIYGNKEYYPNSAGLFISSVRIYKSRNHQLIISHLEAGHELAMGYMERSSEPETNWHSGVPAASEHKPDVDFSALKSAVYQEPLLHHGYGLDVFVLL